MHILILGSGGREHALAWKFAQSPDVNNIHVYPGNAGISEIAICPTLINDENETILDYAIKHNIGLTIVGQEVYLKKGIVDVFQSHGLTIFGPTKQAAQIETSKAFSKALMKKYHIPTARFEVFSDYMEAYQYALFLGFPVVIKADGLAQGKGVYIAYNEGDVKQALNHLFKAHAFVVIETFLKGEEFSFMVLAHGEHVISLPVARDYKKISEDATSLNTGGMGAYSDLPDITDADKTFALDHIIKPTLKALIQEGYPFSGVLYAGLIKTEEGIYTIEFNARFGDPETEVILPRVQDDLAHVILALLQGITKPLSIKQTHTVGVVLANKGYPEAYEKQWNICLPQTDLLVFHMGTIKDEKGLHAVGGRVLILVAEADSLEEARDNVYGAINAYDSSFYCRKDIAKLA